MSDATDSTWSDELESLILKGQQETILLAIIGICAGGVILLGVALNQLSNIIPSFTISIFLVLLAGLTWLINKRNYALAAWILVIGITAAILFLYAWEKIDLVVLLLAIPCGLCFILLSRGAGLAMVSIVSLWLLVSPQGYRPDDPILRTIILCLIWGMVGMIWITFRPLLAYAQWAWNGYARNNELLENARRYQTQLVLANDDLQAANSQLLSLNNLAQSLRLDAENERRIKEEFVANVSHELRTPLNMIIGFSEMVIQSPETYGWNIPAKLLADLAVVLRNSRHLSSLIDDVLDLSQLEVHQMALRKDYVSLEDLVQSATLAVQPLFVSKNLELHKEIEHDLPLVFCDRTRIREVLLNLLSNAGRFTDQGGVWVRARREEKDVFVYVRDTGTGISEEAIQKLFQPFQQVEENGQRRFGGSGLGLSISKKFVELHDGRMWVESKIGEGTTFTFRIPINPPAPLESSALRWLNPYADYMKIDHPVTPITQPLPQRIVVVEQGNLLARFTGRYLDQIEIVSRETIEEAFVEVSRQPALAVLVNTRTIEGSLAEIEKWESAPSRVPVILCTIPEAAQYGDLEGIKDYLVKPISREKLLGAIEQLERPVQTVLLVEDEPDASQLFARMLGETGHQYRVLRAADGQQALEILAAQSVDAILMDLLMPKMNGYQLLKILRKDEKYRDIPVILISARDPFAQPLTSPSLVITCKRGLTAQEMLEFFKVIPAILGNQRVTAGLKSPEAVPG